MYLASILCVFTLFVTLGSSVSGQESLASRVASEYVKERDDFFSGDQKSPNDREDFYLSWRDRLLIAARQELPSEGSCRALALAEAISNSLEDPVTAASIVEDILENCPDDAAEWLIELGDVKRSAWRKTGDSTYGRQALDAFFSAAETDGILASSRVLVSGWAASLCNSDFANQSDLIKASSLVDRSIDYFVQGGKETGRLEGVGFDLRWFLNTSLSFAIWRKQFEVAGQRSQEILENKESGGRLTLCGQIVEADGSLHMLDLQPDVLDAYSNFIDQCTSQSSSDPFVVGAELIPARRLVEEERYEEAQKRLEAILNEREHQLNNSKHGAYAAAEIWTMLRLIYSKQRMLDRAELAAQNAIRYKEQIGATTVGESVFLKQKQAEKSFFSDISTPTKKQSVLTGWILAVNIFIVTALLLFLFLKKTSK